MQVNPLHQLQSKLILYTHLVSWALNTREQGDVSNPHMKLSDQVFTHFLDRRLNKEHLILDKDLMSQNLHNHNKERSDKCMEKQELQWENKLIDFTSEVVMVF